MKCYLCGDKVHIDNLCWECKYNDMVMDLILVGNQNV